MADILCGCNRHCSFQCCSDPAAAGGEMAWLSQPVIHGIYPVCMLHTGRAVGFGRRLDRVGRRSARYFQWLVVFYGRFGARERHTSG